MRINSNISIHKAMNGYNKNVNNVKKTGKTAMKRDQISISQSSKDFQVAMNAFKKLPETRQEKVDNISNEIEKGTYKPSTKDIINKMMSGAR